MTLMRYGTTILRAPSGELAGSSFCCCNTCCGCDWLYNYWQNGGRLRVTISGAITGYIILDPAQPPQGSCLYWYGDDTSNLTDDCALFPQSASISCLSSDKSTSGIILGFGTGSGTCELSELVQASITCGPPLEIVYTGTIEEITVGGCVCDVGDLVTFTITAEDIV